MFMLDASRSQSLAAWCTLEKQLLAVGALDWAKTGEASASRSQSLTAWYVAEKQSLAVRWAGWLPVWWMQAGHNRWQHGARQKNNPHWLDHQSLGLRYQPAKNYSPARQPGASRPTRQA
jgi:hypothetical protein